MKRFLAIMALVGAGSSASALQIKCNGDYLSYHFKVRAQTSGTRLTSKIHVVVMEGGRIVAGSELSPTSSDIQAQRYLRFSGTSASGNGALNASFSESVHYQGTLTAQIKAGTVQVSVLCSLKPVAFTDAAEMPALNSY